MVRELYRPELPDNEKNRILQLHVEFSKIKRYKKCLVGVDDNHGGPVVRGHLIPRSWLQRISSADHVMVIVSQPVNLRNISSTAPFIEIHINNALVRHFTCLEHEKIFYPTDNVDADLTDLGNLNLMAYKAVMGQQWLEKLLAQAFRNISSESPMDEVFRLQARLHTQNSIGLKYYKRQIERCLNPQNCRRCMGGPCKTVGHRVMHVKGEPTLAVSQFTSGSRSRWRPIERQIEHIANWGITVLPTAKGHTAVLHYFLEEESVVQADFGHIHRLQGRKRESAISELIIKSCENVALSPAWWEQIGSRRNAIEAMFTGNMPDIGFGSFEQIMKWESDRFEPNRSIVNPNQINLFRQTRR